MSVSVSWRCIGGLASTAGEQRKAGHYALHVPVGVRSKVRARRRRSSWFSDALELLGPDRRDEPSVAGR